MRHVAPLLLLATIGCSAAPVISLDDTKEDAAYAKAIQLVTAAKAHAVKTGEWELPSLDPLIPYLEGGEKELLDPWGARFQFRYVTEDNSERLVIWTVNPTTGKKVGAPKELVEK